MTSAASPRIATDGGNEREIEFHPDSRLTAIGSRLSKEGAPLSLMPAKNQSRWSSLLALIIEFERVTPQNFGAIRVLDYVFIEEGDADFTSGTR